MTPKIDYSLLGSALDLYRERGYEYVEVPWVVSDKIIRATLPAEFGYFEQVMEDRTSADHDCACAPRRTYTSQGGLIGSAEQGFLALGLKPGYYVGVSPCFRDENPIDLLRRPYFMKIELFAPGPDTSPVRVLDDARAVQEHFLDCAGEIAEEKTNEGVDLMLGGIEIGSYGEREVHPFGRWVYGTGMALPRYSVAQALASVT